MMATTHVLAGLALASAVSLLAPEVAVPAVIGGILGGAFPDFDLYSGHRKTLHFPVYYSMLAVPTVAFAVVAPTPVTVGLAMFFVAAGLHAAGDVLGGGLELRPWRGTSERAVFDHSRGRWLEPRRWIRYDGAPEDLGLAILLAIPSVVVFDGVVETFVLGAVAVSAVYVVVRKPLAWLSEQAVNLVPAGVHPYIPDRILYP